MEDPYDDDELDTKKSPLVRIVAFVLVIGLVLYFTDLFFELVL